MKGWSRCVKHFYTSAELSFPPYSPDRQEHTWSWPFITSLGNAFPKPGHGFDCSQQQDFHRWRVSFYSFNLAPIPPLRSMQRFLRHKGFICDLWRTQTTEPQPCHCCLCPLNLQLNYSSLPKHACQTVFFFPKLKVNPAGRNSLEAMSCHLSENRCCWCWPQHPFLS